MKGHDSEIPAGTPTKPLMKHSQESEIGSNLGEGMMEEMENMMDSEAA